MDEKLPEVKRRSRGQATAAFVGREWHPKPRVTFSNSMTSPKNKMLPRARGLPIARCQLMHKLRHPADINKPLQEAAKEKVAKYQSD